jgi:dimethylargininase
MFTHAITRGPGPNLAEGITTSKPEPPDYDLARRQHDRYVDTLKSLGLQIVTLDPLPDYPDAYFVEDTAVVTPDVAVITIPGAKSWRGETEAIEPALAEYRPVKRIVPPGLLDGGDVLMLGKHFLIGVSKRTNKEGAAQLGRILEEHGYTWMEIPVRHGLHLKSNASCIGENRLLVNKTLARFEELKTYDKIVVDKDERSAANTLLIRDQLLVPMGFPKTRLKLEVAGLRTIELDISEIRKMDGGLSCMSLRF